MKNTKVQEFANSIWFDIVGVIIVLGAVIAMGYIYTPLNASWLFKGVKSTLPIIGIASTINALLSITSTRLVSRVNNLGNIIGTINAVLSGVIDFLLGNIGAVITYPVSVYLNGRAAHNWKSKYNKSFGDIKNTKRFFTLLIAISFAVSYALNAIVYVYIAHWELNALFYFVVLTFALSLMANMLNTIKMPSQWAFWGIYNFAQLGKAITQMNIANAAKYFYYIVNSIVTGLSWVYQKAAQRHQ